MSILNTMIIVCVYQIAAWLNVMAADLGLADKTMIHSNENQE